MVVDDFPDEAFHQCVCSLSCSVVLNWFSKRKHSRSSHPSRNSESVAVLVYVYIPTDYMYRFEEF